MTATADPRPGRHLSTATAWALALWLACIATPLLAQTPPPAPATTEPAGRVNIAGWRAELDRIAAATKREGITDRELESLRQSAETVRAETARLIAELQPELDAVKARVDQLTPKVDPKADKDAERTPESDDLKAERQAQQTRQSALDADVRQAAAVQLQADDTVRTIGDIRRDRFTRTLLARTRSAFDPTLWYEAAGAVPRAIGTISLMLREWAGIMGQRGTETGWALIALAAGVLAVLVSPIRRRFIIVTERDAAAIAPPWLRKTLAALAIVVVNVGLPVLGVLMVRLTLTVLELRPDRVDAVLAALTDAVAASIGIWALSKAVLAPLKPQWRLVNLADAPAERLHHRFTLLAVVYAIGSFVGDVSTALYTPVALTIALTGVAALVDVAVLMLILSTIATSLHDAAPAVSTGADDDQEPPSALWGWLLPAAWLACFAVIVAATFGYVALARFIVTEMVWAGSILAVLYIVLTLVDEAISAAVEPGTRLTSMLVRSMGLSRPVVDQGGVIISGLLRLILIAGAFLTIVGPLGVSISDLRDAAHNAFFGIKIGDLTLSLSSILIGIVLFIAGLLVTRATQGWLENRLLPRTQIDAGLKNSIRTSFGYVGFVLAAIIGFSAAGLSLNNVAIVAGALSVGIGFGLQSVVNNFVSGLILLAERPIKTGDLIEIGTEKGIVRKINVRSTEVETFDRASLIVPNSSLISGNVKNYMHRDQTGRCVVDLTVPQSTDAQLVRQLLLQTAGAHQQVMLIPAPGVMLTALADTGLKFRLYCTVGSVLEAASVESDLRFAALAALHDAGVRLAGPAVPSPT